MALAEHPTVTAADGNRIGVLRRIDAVAEGSALAFADDTGATHRVVLADAPDPMAARRATAGMRRVHWARVDHGPLGTTASVAGTGHRLPVRCTVSVAAALALAAGGVPTVVSVRGEA